MSKEYDWIIAQADAYAPENAMEAIWDRREATRMAAEWARIAAARGWRKHGKKGGWRGVNHG